MKVRTARIQDAAAITGIYNHYVRESHATLEYDLADAPFFERKMNEIFTSGHNWLVAEQEDGIEGYAYSRRWNTRHGYAFTCEVSVYIAPDSKEKGIGTALYEELFNRLRQAGMHAVIAVIGLPNEASVALHEKFGMREAAHFPELGIKFENWLDVGYWYCNL